MESDPEINVCNRKEMLVMDYVGIYVGVVIIIASIYCLVAASKITLK